MLKVSSQLASALPATGVDNSEVISNSCKNNRKSIKSDLTKPVYRAEEPSFLISDIKQAFTQLKQAFAEAPIF